MVVKNVFINRNTKYILSFVILRVVDKIRKGGCKVVK